MFFDVAYVDSQREKSRVYVREEFLVLQLVRIFWPRISSNQLVLVPPLCSVVYSLVLDLNQRSWLYVSETLGL